MRHELPNKVSFSGHESFPLRSGWLKKAYDLTEDNERGRDAFKHDRAMGDLGVGKNMVKSIRHWSLVTGVLEEIRSASTKVGGLKRTAFADLLFSDEGGLDPYLEHPASAWVLHWKLATNGERATTWYWAFNHLGQRVFAPATFLSRLERAMMESGRSYRATQATLKRDFDCFVRSYVPPRSERGLNPEESYESPFIALRLVDRLAESGAYRFGIDSKPSLPNEILAHAVAEFAATSNEGVRSLSFERLAYDPGSPGQVFKLDAGSLLERLEALEDVTDGLLTFDSSGGHRTLRVHTEDLHALSLSWLKAAYV